MIRKPLATTPAKSGREPLWKSFMKAITLLTVSLAAALYSTGAFGGSLVTQGKWEERSRILVADFRSPPADSALGGAVTVFTHLEPVEDELSMEDMSLDR